MNSGFFDARILVMKATFGQLIRYGVVGLLSNGLIYALYLFATEVGTEPKVAMTLLYILGVVQSFAFNRTWSFRHGGAHGPAFVRYCVTYAMGYLVNLLGLYVFTDRFGWSHEAVQACMIFVVAGLLFVLQKWWVFEPVETQRHH